LQTRPATTPPPARAPHQRLRAALRAWWLARHGESDAITLTQRIIYILPTRAGWMFGVTLCLLLVGAINYQLNLGYALTFLLAGAGASALIVGHGVLRGLRLSLSQPQPVFAGDALTLNIRLLNARSKPRPAIGVALHATRQWTWADVPARGTAAAPIAFTAKQRGLHPIPRLIAETRYPLGIFRVWTLWQPQSQVLVYPRPERQAPPLPDGMPHPGSGLSSNIRAAGEFDGIRAYRRGDPSKLIVWKKWAQSGQLVSRDTTQIHGRQLWLDWTQTGLAEPEARLSRLTAWVLAADAAQLEYGLRLPALQIAPGRGTSHRQRCLHALATS